MAVTRKETEAIPATYPAWPSGLTTEAAALNPSMIWQRIEAFCRVRWTPRELVWIVEGSGDWEAPLNPATVQTIEVWNDQVWQTASPDASPFGGYVLPDNCTYRITAQVGGGDVPAVVSEAYRRLAEYSAEIGKNGLLCGVPGASSHSSNIDGAIVESYDRPSAWAGHALQYSGAADLLRPYRRIK